MREDPTGRPWGGGVCGLRLVLLFVLVPVLVWVVLSVMRRFCVVYTSPVPVVHAGGSGVWVVQRPAGTQ